MYAGRQKMNQDALNKVRPTKFALATMAWNRRFWISADLGTLCIPYCMGNIAIEVKQSIDTTHRPLTVNRK